MEAGVVRRERRRVKSDSDVGVLGDSPVWVVHLDAIGRAEVLDLGLREAGEAEEECTCDEHN